MVQLSNIQNLYFLGIGGIGMSALARYFHNHGKQVAGYDRSPSTVTAALRQAGVEVIFEDTETALQQAFRDKESTLVVYTPAIPADNALRRWFENKGFRLVKRAELLGEITRTTKCLAVAGTHGKTTTTALLAHLLAEAGTPMTAFLGGVAEGYESNLVQRGEDITVVEADEFDRSFLQLNPFIAGITAMDADHLDIYGNEANFVQTFTDFAALVPDNGALLHKKGLPLDGQTVAVEEAADFEARNPQIHDGTWVFDIKTPPRILKNCRLSLPGRHNLFNATLAVGMAYNLGVDLEKLKAALATFRGVKRRFSYKLKTENHILIDDYAHHPAEIDAVHQAIREMYPTQKAMVVFQPHLYSRTRDFADGFAKALSCFDAVRLLDIYPAREQPIAGISAQWLLDKISVKDKQLVSKEALPQSVKNTPIKVVAMLGAGDIGDQVEKVAECLMGRCGNVPMGQRDAGRGKLNR